LCCCASACPRAIRAASVGVGGGGIGGSVSMKSAKPRRSLSVSVFATAVIAGLSRRPSRNKNNCVIA
jgi:hypothetical protein